MTLLDIGCGWGFLLIEAAKKYKIKGTGITLSEEQYKECQKRIKEEGLSDYLEVRLMDYRDLPSDGKMYDRVVSVGMLEHVGRENYQLYLDCVSKVMKDGGLFLLTEKGIASQESFEDIVEHIEEELSEGISEEELHIFYKVLDRINQNVKKYEVR